MNLTASDIKILENFSEINSSILFLDGEYQCTVSNTKSCFAKAKLDSKVGKEFGIYDLRKLLSIVSMFKEPEFSFQEKQMTITEKDDKRRKIVYKFCPEEMIKFPPKGKSIDVKDPLETFELSEQFYSQIVKTSSIFGHDYIKIYENDGKIVVSTIDESDLTKDRKEAEGASFEVGETTKSDFVYFLKISNLRFIAGSYDVTIADNFLKFKNQSVDIYYICPYQEVKDVSRTISE